MPLMESPHSAKVESPRKPPGAVRTPLHDGPESITAIRVIGALQGSVPTILDGMHDMTTDNPTTHETDPLVAKPFRAKIGFIFFLTGIFFINFMARLILAPLMPSMEQDLHLTHGEAGALFLLMTAGYFVTLAGSGFISSRLGHRRAIIVSTMALGAAMLLAALSGSELTLRAGVVLLGAGAGLYLPSGIAIITSIIRPENWGKAIAIHEIAPNLSFIMAPLVAEALLGFFSWRGVLAVLGVVSLLSGVAFIRFGARSQLRGEAPSLATMKTLVSLPSFWIMLLLFGMGIGSQAGIFAMMPLYLVAERGLDRTWANALIALTRISGLFMAFVAGWINDRVGPKKTLTYFLLSTGVATVLLAYSQGPWLVLLLFVQPALASGFFPSGFSALSRIGPPQVRNVAVALTVPLGLVIGNGALPTMIGYLGEAGTFSLGIALGGVFICLGPALIRFLKYQEEDPRKS